MDDLSGETGPVSTLVARVVCLHAGEGAAPAEGDLEHKVADELDRLPASWRVIPTEAAVSAGTGIDHVAIGPGGVFTVTTKQLPHTRIWVAGDAFLVNRTNRPYVRTARYEAERAAQLLTALTGFPVPVVGVIALLGAQRGFTQKSQPSDGAVHVTRLQHLVEWLRGLPPMLTPEGVDAVADWVRRPEIWE